MQKIIFSIAVALIFVSCKTTNRVDSQTSGDISGTAYSIFRSATSADTPEEELQALVARLDALNIYTNQGTEATIGNCPIGDDDPCSMVNVVIEFETPGSGSVGHTAIAISNPFDGLVDPANREDQFFDFGPGRSYYVDDKGTETEDDDVKVNVKVGDPGIFALPPGTFSGLFSSVPGTQWWDNPWRFADPSKVTPSNITLTDIIKDIDNIAGDYTVVRVPICMTKEHAMLITKWWVKAYSDMPDYKIPGDHCTSMVANSIEKTAAGAKELIRTGGVSSSTNFSKYLPDPRTIHRAITSPTAYAKRVLGGDYNSAVDYRHQCGDLKGKNPKAIMIKNNSLFDKDNVKTMTKWKVDKSIP